MVLNRLGEDSSQIILLFSSMIDRFDCLNDRSVDRRSTFGRESGLNQIEEISQDQEKIGSVFSE